MEGNGALMKEGIQAPFRALTAPEGQEGMEEAGSKEPRAGVKRWCSHLSLGLLLQQLGRDQKLHGFRSRAGNVAARAEWPGPWWWEPDAQTPFKPLLLSSRWKKSRAWAETGAPICLLCACVEGFCCLEIEAAGEGLVCCTCWLGYKYF